MIFFIMSIEFCIFTHAHTHTSYITQHITTTFILYSMIIMLLLFHNIYISRAHATSSVLFSNTHLHYLSLTLSVSSSIKAVAVKIGTDKNFVPFCSVFYSLSLLFLQPTNKHELASKPSGALIIYLYAHTHTLRYR